MSSRAHCRVAELLVAGLAAISVLSAARGALADTAPEEGSGAPADPAASKPPRPPPLPPLKTKPLAWEHLIQVGGELAFVARPASSDSLGQPSGVRYQAASGFGVHVRAPLLPFLQMEVYYLDFHQPVSVANGALGVGGAVSSPPAETYVFGGRIAPRIVWGRLTGWLSAGAGWGRIELGRMTVTTASGATFTLRERGGSFVELPFGIGAQWEIVPRWLSIELQSIAAVVIGQRGDVFTLSQTVDAEGHLRDVRPMPYFDASLVQTIGLTLHL